MALDFVKPFKELRMNVLEERVNLTIQSNAVMQLIYNKASHELVKEAEGVLRKAFKEYHSTYDAVHFIGRYLIQNNQELEGLNQGELDALVECFEFAKEHSYTCTLDKLSLYTTGRKLSETSNPEAEETEEKASESSNKEVETSENKNEVMSKQKRKRKRKAPAKCLCTPPSSCRFCVPPTPSPRHEPLCMLCLDCHRLWLCPVFRSKAPWLRLHLVDCYKLCRLCFNRHRTEECRTEMWCQVPGCKGRHNTYIHQVKRWPKKSVPKTTKSAPKRRTTTAPKKTETAPEKTKMAPAKTEKALANTEMAPDMTKMQPEKIDTATQMTEIAHIANELALIAVIVLMVIMFICVVGLRYCFCLSA